jgi:hypothetical protein
MKWLGYVLLGICLMACGTPQQEAPPVEEVAVEVKQEVVVDVNPCANPPTHDCCAATTPECNQCRAKYEGFIRACPDAVDKRIRVPVDTNMEWASRRAPEQEDEDDLEGQMEDMPEGVHFRSDSELSGKAFLTCDELEEALCCRGESPDCISCRLKARDVVSTCRKSGEGGIPILHSPVGIPGQMNAMDDPKKQWGQSKPPGLQ